MCWADIFVVVVVGNIFVEEHFVDLEALENKELVYWAGSFVVDAIGNVVVEENFVDIMVFLWHQGY